MIKIFIDFTLARCCYTTACYETRDIWYTYFLLYIFVYILEKKIRRFDEIENHLYAVSMIIEICLNIGM